MKKGSLLPVATGEATYLRGLRPTGTHEAVARIANRWTPVTNIIDYYWANNVYWVVFKRMHPDGRSGVTFDVPAEAVDLLSPAAIF